MLCFEHVFLSYCSFGMRLSLCVKMRFECTFCIFPLVSLIECTHLGGLCHQNLTKKAKKKKESINTFRCLCSCIGMHSPFHGIRVDKAYKDCHLQIQSHSNILSKQKNDPSELLYAYITGISLLN